MDAFVDVFAFFGFGGGHKRTPTKSGKGDKKKEAEVKEKLGDNVMWVFKTILFQKCLQTLIVCVEVHVPKAVKKVTCPKATHLFNQS